MIANEQGWPHQDFRQGRGGGVLHLCRESSMQIPGGEHSCGLWPQLSNETSRIQGSLSYHYGYHYGYHYM